MHMPLTFEWGLALYAIAGVDCWDAPSPWKPSVV